MNATQRKEYTNVHAYNTHKPHRQILRRGIVSTFRNHFRMKNMGRGIQKINLLYILPLSGKKCLTFLNGHKP